MVRDDDPAPLLDQVDERAARSVLGLPARTGVRAGQDAYAKLNARLALGAQSGRWELAFIGRNLTDEKTISYSGDTPLAGSTFFARSYYGFTDPPRTLALEAMFRF